MRVARIALAGAGDLVAVFDDLAKRDEPHGLKVLGIRHPLADVSAKAAAPLGAAFTFLALVTGSLWGRPMWGTYWVWDGRLTSVLILFFLYLGLIALRSSLDDEALAGKLTAILAVLGIVILPVIKFSVDWWQTLHQPSTRFTSTLDPSFRIPLLVMASAFAVGFVAMHLKAMRNEILRRRVRALTISLVDRARPDDSNLNTPQLDPSARS